MEEGAYIRFGSTNRSADAAIISEIKRLKEHKYFDEQPNFDCSVSEINFSLAKDLFVDISKKFTDRTTCLHPHQPWRSAFLYKKA